MPAAHDRYPARQGYNIELTLGHGRVQVALFGDIDIAAGPGLRSLLDSLTLIRNDLCVNLTANTLIDSTGLGPLVEATRARRQDLALKLLVGSCSPAVLQLLDAPRMDAGPLLDVHRWDHMSACRSACYR